MTDEPLAIEPLSAPDGAFDFVRIRDEYLAAICATFAIPPELMPPGPCIANYVAAKLAARIEG